MQPFLMISGGLGFIFVMTCLGAATVFIFKKQAVDRFQQVFLGFAAGVMISASIWCLLIPAIDLAESGGLTGWIPAACGFVPGVLFLLVLDHMIPHLRPRPHLRPKLNIEEGFSHASKRTMLVFAVTIHNIPEGMAVGLSFALAAQHNNPAMYAAAVALAIGIGIQNFPEGAAISLPLRLDGASAGKAFGLACLSGAVEPVFGALAVLLAPWIAPFMPWLLSFAAGAMIYVVIEELIPETHFGEHSHIGTLSFLAGFLVMMVLDVALE